MCPPCMSSSSGSNDSGYIYLLREREFIKSDENIYKVGKTINYHRRFQNYPKNSHVICVMSTESMSTAERKLLKGMRDNVKLVNRKDIGREYFEGNLRQIKQIFFRVMKKME